MKTKHLLIIIMALLLPYLATAQSASKFIFEKYSGKKGFTSISVSGELFRMMMSSDSNSDVVTIGGVDINKNGIDFSNLKGIKILNINAKYDGEDIKDAENALKEAELALKKDINKYTELLQLNSNGENINIMASKNNSKKTQDIILYRFNGAKKEATLILIEGSFDEEMVNKIINESMNQQKKVL